jgi:hypothetical protein
MTLIQIESGRTILIDVRVLRIIGGSSNIPSNIDISRPSAVKMR